METSPPPDLDDSIDFADLWRRLRRGLPLTLGLALLGLAIAAVLYLAARPFTSATTSTRVVFAFKGYELGEYPDHSKFNADDLRAPDLVATAIKRLQLDSNEEFQSKIRAGLTIEGIISPNVIKERDRLRATGQIQPAFIPDEYHVLLTLPERFPLERKQREALVREIVTAYRDKFQRTYADLPLTFGNVMESLRDNDLFEYDAVFTAEIQNITTYLDQQAEQAKTFRAATTNLSFGDLIKLTQLFRSVNLNQTLGLIRVNNASKDRKMALVRLDYMLKTLEDQERIAIEEDKASKEYLDGTQARTQNYVLGVKSHAQQPRTDSPMLDQGLVDSLLANDAYNFLVRKALDATLKLKRIQAEQTRLKERRKEMEAALNDALMSDPAITTQIERSLKPLIANYDQLIVNIRKTYADYVSQQFGNAVRLSNEVQTESYLRPTIMASGIGLLLGLVCGTGLSLLGVNLGRNKPAAPSR